MADYSFVHDANDKVVGMWFRDPANATTEMIGAALDWKQVMSPDQIEAAMLDYQYCPERRFDKNKI